MSDYFDNIDPDTIDLNNLPPSLQVMVAILLTVQHCGNRPADLGDLMHGLYGKMSDHSPESAITCCNEFARVLTRLHSLGWISQPMNGTIILTDIGDEQATILKRFYEGTGRIDFSRLT